MSGTAWELAQLTVDEWRALPLTARILSGLGLYADWGYSLLEPRVAFSSPSIPSRIIEPAAKVTNCSTLTASLVTAAYPGGRWTAETYGMLQVFRELLPATDTPVQAVEIAGVGGRSGVFVEGEWHLVQGVRRRAEHGFSGHAILAQAFPGGALMVVEAWGNKDGGPGPRIRWTDLGGLQREFPAAVHIAVLGAG